MISTNDIEIENAPLDKRAIVKANGIKIWYETFGKPNHPALLLLMGNSCDAFMWPLEFCEQLASNGWYVIRFDQRDTGLSSRIDFEKSPYTLQDMANDALALLDYLDIQKAHLLGYATGGAIAMHFVLHHQNRLASTILMMTSFNLHIKNEAFQGKDTSQAELSPPKKNYITDIKAVVSKGAKTQEEKIRQYVELFKLSNGTKLNFDVSYFYALFEKSQKRLQSLSNVSNSKVGHESNHALATSATKILNKKQRQSISLPILIIAGGEDPIFQVDHAHQMNDTFLNSTLYIIEELGHVLNPFCFEKIIAILTKHMKNVNSNFE